jgi:uncharacterized protein YjbJ (UPF0337 family)
MNRDEAAGKAEELKGKTKKTVAHITDDPQLHDEGDVDEAAGKTRAAVGTAKRKVGEAVESAGKAIKR